LCDTPVAVTIEDGRLVLSPAAFDRFALALACPVARGGSSARGRAWTVALAEAGLATDGVVLCNQVARVATPIE